MQKAKSKGTGAPFTPREEEILRLLADIRTNDEICAELCIEEGTLENHFKNIQRKRNLYGSRKILLIRYAVEHGYGRKVTA